MAFRRLILVAIAIVSSLLLDSAGACSCLAGRGLCDYYASASVVVRGTVLSRTDGASINDYATYTANTSTVYKSEPNVVYAQVISFVTGGNSAACGVNLTIGEEYLFPLSRISNSFFEPEVDGELSASLCSPPQVWSSVNETELNGCS
ncbi:unnamed protein product [Ascophyllum nodosum]